MKQPSRTIAVNDLQADAMDIVCTLEEQGGPLIITHNGEARAVLQDIDSFESAQETMALLKMLALGPGAGSGG
jgi:prevent-host-death family protein